jgi:hypothetical protein
MVVFLEIIAGALLGTLAVGLCFFVGLRGGRSGTRSRLPDTRQASSGETVFGSSVPPSSGSA